MDLFRSGEELIFVTGDSPTGFAGVLFVCYRGDTPDSVSESVIAANQLTNLERVSPESLPADWRRAFGLPDPEPKKPPKPETQAAKRSTPRGVKVRRPRPSLELQLGHSSNESSKPYWILVLYLGLLLNGTVWLVRIIFWN